MQAPQDFPAPPSSVPRAAARPGESSRAKQHPYHHFGADSRADGFLKRRRVSERLRIRNSLGGGTNGGPPVLIWRLSKEAIMDKEHIKGAADKAKGRREGRRRQDDGRQGHCRPKERWTRPRARPGKPSATPRMRSGTPTTGSRIIWRSERAASGRPFCVIMWSRGVATLGFGARSSISAPYAPPRIPPSWAGQGRSTPRRRRSSSGKAKLSLRRASARRGDRQFRGQQSQSASSPRSTPPEPRSA